MKNIIRKAIFFFWFFVAFCCVGVVVGAVVGLPLMYAVIGAALLTAFMIALGFTVILAGWAFDEDAR